MKYMLVIAVMVSVLYIGMTQLAFEAVQSIAPYYQHADEIAQRVVER